jgi:hypothetical protein
MTKQFFDKIVCDETNNTKQDVDNGVVNADIYGFVVDKVDIVDITIELNVEKKND